MVASHLRAQKENWKKAPRRWFALLLQTVVGSSAHLFFGGSRVQTFEEALRA